MVQSNWGADGGEIAMNQTQLEDFFKNQILTILGYNPATTHDRVRISWPTRGQPAWNVTDNVAFLRITPEDDPALHQQDTIYSKESSVSVKTKKQYQRQFAVAVICYGPSAWEDAEVIWNGFLSEPVQETLTKNHFGYIDRTGPVRAPELYNGQWWNRTDLQLRFYELLEQESVINAFGSVTIGGAASVGNGSEIDDVPVKVILVDEKEE
jgi:hypothetical protein